MTGARPAAKRRRRIRRGALLLPAVLACFLGSIVARLASGTGLAIAEGVEHLMPAAVSPPGGGAESPLADCPSDARLSLIIDRLSGREKAVADSEKRQEARRLVLAAAERRISERLADLRAAEEKLAATMSRTATASEDDLARLTAVYEAMKPKDAVPLFEAMAPEFAAGFLGRMRPDAAAAVLAGMSAEKAYAVSVLLAGRNAAVPVPPERAAE